MTDHNDTQGAAQQLHLEGELTIYAAADLKQKLLAPLDDHAEVEVDLSGIGEVDTAGLQLLVLAKREAAARNKSLRLANHSPAVLEALELCNLHGFFGDPVVLPSGRG